MSWSSNGGRVVGVNGSVLARSLVGRGQESSREVVGQLRGARRRAVLVASGGIGGNLDLVRRYWPERLGPPPREMVAGVPASTDGRMLEVAERAGASWIGRDRMWHYTEGVRNWNPVWQNHGIRILPGALVDVVRRDRQAPAARRCSRASTRSPRSRTSVRAVMSTPGSCSIAGSSPGSSRCRAPSRTRTSPARTSRRPCARACCRRCPAPIQAFLDHGEDFVVADRPPRAGRRHERPHRRAAAASTRRSSARSSRATARSPTPSARTCR